MNRVRGYIFSRPFMGERVPQHIQNLVIREYCNKKKLIYLLSLTEYAMPNCHLMLNQALSELEKLDGIVAYSLFQLPEKEYERQLVIKNILKYGKTLHFAAEGLKLSNELEHKNIEILWRIKQTLSKCPKFFEY